jgi:hypothetical protein
MQGTNTDFNFEEIKERLSSKPAWNLQLCNTEIEFEENSWDLWFFFYVSVYGYVCLFRSKRALSVGGRIEPSKRLIKYRTSESKFIFC